MRPQGGLRTVVLTGSESTGKTTLARRLAAHHETAWSSEFVREYLERKGAPLTAADVEAIAMAGPCAKVNLVLEEEPRWNGTPADADPNPRPLATLEVSPATETTRSNVLFTSLRVS